MSPRDFVSRQNPCGGNNGISAGQELLSSHGTAAAHPLSGVMSQLLQGLL